MIQSKILTEYYLFKWQIILFCLALLFAKTPELIAIGLNNIASNSLLTEWQSDNQSLGIPTCQKNLQTSSVKRLTRQALQYYPNYQRAWVSMGRVAWLVGDCDSAVNAFENALMITPNDVYSRLDLTSIYLVMGQEDKALTHYDEAMLHYGDDYFYSQGQLAEARGEIDIALMWYEYSLVAEPSWQPAQAIVKIYQYSGRTEDILTVWFELANATSEETPDHWWALGQVAEFHQHWQKAFTYYENGLELGGDAYDFHWRMGSMAKQAGDLVNAEVHFLQAMEVSPYRLSPYLTLGRLAEDRGDYSTALDWYQRAGNLDPTSELPEYHRGAFFWRRGQRTAACEWFETAGQKNPGNAQVNYYLGRCAYEAGSLDRAITYMEAAVRLKKGQPWIWWLTLGDWYAKAGRLDDARKAYEQVLSWHLDDERALEMLDSLGK